MVAGATGDDTAPVGGKSKFIDLLYPVRFAPVGGDCLTAMVMQAPPCPRKGYGPLTPIAKNCRFACGGADDGLCRMTAGAVSTQAWRLALSGRVTPVGGDCLTAMVMRTLPCTCKGYSPLS